MAFCMDCQKSTYFYPRSPCGERHRDKEDCKGWPAISIHALLAESDTDEKRLSADWKISIHALLAESDTDNQEKTKKES